MVGELHTDHISVGNKSRKTQGVLRFVEVGEGISEGNDEELQDINNPTNNENDLEDQPVGNDIEEEEHPTEEELQLKEIIILLLVNCGKKMNFAVLAGIGSGIDNTNELKVLGFIEAMASPDKDNWQASVD